MTRDKYTAAREKRKAVNDAEVSGMIADSTTVRIELITKMERGEMTLEEVQAEIKRIKRNAKRDGKITRQQAFSRG